MSLSKLEQEIDQCTDEKNTKDDWNQIYECVDLVNSSRRQKDALKILVKKLRHRNPHVSMQALTLLDSCAANCGHEFHRELCSKSFCSDAKSILGNKSINGQVLQRFAYLLRKWSQMDEIRKDSTLGLLADLVSDLRDMGFSFDYDNATAGSLDAAASNKGRGAASGGGSSGGGGAGSGGGRSGGGSAAAAASSSSSSNRAKSQQQDLQKKEEDDFKKAIELSLQDQQQKRSASPRSGGVGGATGGGGGSIYPSMSGAAATSMADYHQSPVGTAPPPPVVKRVRALYDFLAAEDNELTFHTGDVILVDDCSDPNWWHGSTQAGAAGLFPATFVEEDTGKASPPGAAGGGKGVSFNDQVAVKLIEEPVSIDPGQIDECLALLENCDPTGDPNRPDPPELPQLEERCRLMAPLIDNEIEQLDRKYLELHHLNSRLAEAFQLYHHLMSASAPPPPPSHQQPPHEQQQQQQQQPIFYPPNMAVPSSGGPNGPGAGYASQMPAYAYSGVPPQQQQQQPSAEQLQAYMHHQMAMQQQQQQHQQHQQPLPPPPQQQQQHNQQQGGGQFPPSGYNNQNQQQQLL